MYIYIYIIIYFLVTFFSEGLLQLLLGRCLMFPHVSPHGLPPAVAGSSSKIMKTTQLGSTWGLWCIGYGYPLV